MHSILNPLRLLPLVALVYLPGCQRPMQAEPMMIVSRHVGPLIDSSSVPGVVVGIYLDGREDYLALGALSYTSDTAPDEHTFYETGSVGKLYTALLLVEAERRGEVSLDGPLSQFAAVRRAAPSLAAQDVRLWHLASHLSGLPREPDDLDPALPNPYAGYSRAQLWAALDRAPLQGAPGQVYAYSNLAVGLLGTLLEDATGLTYAEQIDQRIARPLGLMQTVTELTANQSERLAPPFSFGTASINWPADDALAASGCLRSTAMDTLRFVRLHLDPPDSPLGRSLRLTTEQRHSFEQGGGVGLGWHLLDDGTCWHNGSTGGYHTFVAFSREQRLALVLLANDVSPEVTEVGFRLFDALAGRKDQPLTLPIPTELPCHALDALLGRYIDPDSGYSITVTRRGTRLFAQLSGQPAYMILPESETLCRYRAVDARLRFDMKNSGEAGRVTLLQAGTEWTLRRE